MVDVHQSSGSLDSQRSFGFVDQSEIIDVAIREPWLLSENDIQWLIFLGKKRYGSQYDYVTTENWFRNIVLKNPLMFHPIRLEHAFSIGMLSSVPWIPSESEYHIIFICADEGCLWEAAKLLRNSIDWARKRKCKRWRLSSDTEYDMFQLARRLGATEQSPRYSIEL